MECKCNKVSELQAKLDDKVESIQATTFTDAYLKEKIKLEADNALLTLRLQNLQLKQTIENQRAASSNIKL